MKRIQVIIVLLACALASPILFITAPRVPPATPLVSNPSRAPEPDRLAPPKPSPLIAETSLPPESPGPLPPIPLPPLPEIDASIHPPVKNPDARASEIIMFPAAQGDRVAAARRRSESTVRALFSQAGVEYPARQIFLRGLKREAELELWAAGRSGPLKLVATYAAAALSGRPGPKRAEGDGQVPEGFYEIDRFNPESIFHLSLGLNYPNAADRLLSHPERPGYDIFIHGNAVSIGCLAMGDDRIEEIYLAAADSQVRPIPVHLFPARLDAADWPAWRDAQTQADPSLAAFWEQLQPAWDLFESTHQVPKITTLPDGRYEAEPAKK